MVLISDGRIEVNASRLHDEGEPMPEEHLRVMLLTEQGDETNELQSDLIRDYVLKFGQAIADVTQIETYSGNVRYLGGNDFDWQIEQVFRSQDGRVV